MRRFIIGVLLTLQMVVHDLAWGGEILETVPKVPSNLITPIGFQSKTVQKFTSIACFDVRNGVLQDCGFDFTINGLVQPDSDVANNGGHTHDEATHSTDQSGDLRITLPFPGPRSNMVAGSTRFDIFVVSHTIPEVSGKIDTLLNLRVPPGWRTVSPESCDATQTSWCFKTTVDVGVSGLMSLPDVSPFYRKSRNPPPPDFDSAHTNAVAFSGTADANFYLIAIAARYNQLTTRVLSINDMTLVRGGLFDANARLGQDIFSPPHTYHRTGQSADINKDNGDCITNVGLLSAVNLIMPAEPGSFFSERDRPSYGRFLCESNGNIHIDLDTITPPSPSPFQ